MAAWKGDSGKNALERVIGFEKVTGSFGYWPAFHDAEVVWFRLDRRSSGTCQGPTVEALIHAFEMTSDVAPDGTYVDRNHVLVHFCFRGVVEMELSDFNFQNVLFGLTITDNRERQLETIHFEVSFDSSYGMDAIFQSHEVEVLSVSPCDEEGSLL